MKTKHPGVISLSRIRKFNRKNGYNILLISVTLAGVIFGTLICMTYQNETAVNYIECMHLTEKNFGHYFLFSFLSNALCLLILFVFGLCVAGSAFIIMLIFIKASGAGIIAGSIYNLYGIQGIKFCLVVYYPAVIVLLTALIMAGNEGLFTVNEIKSLYNRSGEEKTGISVYLKRFIMPLFSVTVASVIQTLCYYYVCGSFLPE